jgi:ATP-dependent 26S proteasome regulatory subunit
MNKKGWNTFFDSFDIEIYKYVIVIMTSNKHTSYFNDLDPSLLREGRIDIVKDCAENI